MKKNIKTTEKRGVFGSSDLLGVNEFGNRINSLRNLFLACVVICLCDCESRCCGNQPLEIRSPVTKISRDTGRSVSEVWNLVLVEGGKHTRLVESVCRFGTQLNHERPKLSFPISESALSLATGSELVGNESSRQSANDAGGYEPSNLKIWIKVAQEVGKVIVCGLLGGVIGAFIYVRLLTPNM